MAPPRLTPEQLEASKLRRRQKETERRRLLRQDPAFRARERERNTAARREARQDEKYRQREREREALARRRARQDPEYRRKEQERNTEAKRRARRDPAYRELQRAKEAATRELKRYLVEEGTRTAEAHQEAAWLSSFALRYVQKAWTSKEENGSKDAEDSFLNGLEDGSVEPETSTTSTCDEGSRGAETLQRGSVEEDNTGAGSLVVAAKSNSTKETKCSLCPFVSPWPSVTKAHEKLHSENSQSDKHRLRVVCPTLSAETDNRVLYLPTAENLALHQKSLERRPTEDRPFRCDLCSAAFVKAVGLKCHMRVHSADRPFACDICPIAFKHATSLAKHRQSHTPDGEFKCSICFCAFGRQSNLTRHMRHHSEGMAARNTDSATEDGRGSPELISPDGPPLCMDTAEVDSIEVVQCTPELLSAGSSPIADSVEHEAARTDRSALETSSVDDQVHSVKVVPFGSILPSTADPLRREVTDEELITPEVICSETAPATVDAVQLNAVKVEKSASEITFSEDVLNPVVDRCGTSGEVLDEAPGVRIEPSAYRDTRDADLACALRPPSDELDLITPEVISPDITASTSVHPVPLDVVKVESSAADTYEAPSEAAAGSASTEQSTLRKWKRTLQMKCIHDV